MEKESLYPEMQDYQKTHDAPPNYSQSYPSAPTEVMPEIMPSSSLPMHNMQAEQPLQSFAQPQPFAIQNLPPIPPLGPRPCLVTCPSCHQQLMSNVRMETSTKTHLFAALLCIVGLVCCTCIPYCVDSCKNANHYCIKCDAYLGTYTK